MNRWASENSDKLLLAGMVSMFFIGAFVGIRFNNQTLMGAALDQMKFVVGALVGIITGAKIASSGGPEPPSPTGVGP